MATSSPFHANVTLRRCGLSFHLLQRFAADEVVVELDERAVADFVRRRVVVLDVLRDEAAADRAGRFVAVGRQPLAVLLHALVGVDGGQRRRNPAGFQRVGRIGARTDRRRCRTPCRLRRIASRISSHFGRTGPRSPRPARRPCRGAALRTLRPSMLISSMLKNFRSGIGAAVELVDDVLGVRALDLEAVVAARHRRGRPDATASGRRAPS